MSAESGMPLCDYHYGIERIRDWLEREGAAPHEIENVINDCLYDPFPKHQP